MSQKVISEEYRAQIAQVHSGPLKWGGAVNGKTARILNWAEDMLAESILDYGAGYGLFKQQAIEMGSTLDIREYEPAIKEKAAMPEPADLVISVDVLEHVEPEYIDDVIDHIHSLSKKAAYLYPCLVPSFNTLPDGRNLHLIVEDADWWIEKVSRRFYVKVGIRSKAHVEMWCIPVR